MMTLGTEHHMEQLTDSQREAWLSALLAPTLLCAAHEEGTPSRTDLRRLASNVQTSVYRLMFAHGVTVDDDGIPVFADPDITPTRVAKKPLKRTASTARKRVR